MKIELQVADIHAAARPSEAFSLILKEKEGERYVPIIIGMSEARAILVELNQSPTHRPLTHELLVALADSFNCTLVEVDIVHYENGVYYADMLMKRSDNTLLHLDARPSDAISIALKFNAPFFMNKDIFLANCMEDIISEEEPTEKEYNELIDAFNTENEEEGAAIDSFIEQKLKEMSPDELQTLLDGAIDSEDYELAEKIQKELDRR